MPISIAIRSAAPTGKKGKGDDAPSLTFDGARVVIGRGLGCEVRLPDPSVSQRHATVRADGPDYVLVDEGSTNGTFMGDARLAPRTPRSLRSGDLVRVGRVWLEITIDQTPATQDLPSATRDLALRLVADAMKALGDDVTTRVVVVEGPDRGRAVALVAEGRAYRVGRGDACDLLLDDEDVSRDHVQLVRRGAAVILRDLGSKNGAWLGESRLSADRDIPWRSPTMLRIGNTVMALEEPVAMALAELEAAPDDLLPPDGSPPGPTPPPAPAPVPSRRDEAPAAATPMPATREARTRRGAWSSADVAVIVAALTVLAMSAAGLYWLLRG